MSGLLAAAISVIAHAALGFGALWHFDRLAPLEPPGVQAVEVAVLASIPSLALPAPELPPPLAGDLTAVPPPPLPPQPDGLPADLLPAPELAAPKKPAPLPIALAPPPTVPMPPQTPDPGAIVSGALARDKRPAAATSPALRVVQPRMAQKHDAAARKAKRNTRKTAPSVGKQRIAARRAGVVNDRARTSASRAATPASSTRRTASRRADPGASAAYRSLVAARLARNKPSGDVAELAHGTAVVSFQIGASGAATGIRLAKSAGYGALDRAALAAVRRSSPFPPPPPGAGRSFRVPIRFSR